MLVARVLCRINRTIYFFNNCSAKYKNKLDSIKNIIKDKKKKKEFRKYVFDNYNFNNIFDTCK